MRRAEITIRRVKRRRPAGRGSSITKVLIGEEHGIVRDGLRSLLEKHDDMRVVAAVHDGREAVAAAERFLPQVVIMEFNLRLLNGIDATRAIVQRKPETGVIVLSMHDSGTLIQRALHAGARGYLTKDADGEELVKAVREVAAGKRYLGNSVADKVLDTPRRPGAGVLEDLTATECDILRLVVDGKSNAEVANQLRLSIRTVETYRIRLMRKLDIGDLPSLVKFAIRQGITALD
jgi:DNA-binding NarL/FixJ family response regulator